MVSGLALKAIKAALLAATDAEPESKLASPRGSLEEFVNWRLMRSSFGMSKNQGRKKT